MRKPFPFTTLSNVTCSEKNCAKKIKSNLIDRKPTQQNFKCYKHWMKEVFVKRNKRK